MPCGSCVDKLAKKLMEHHRIDMIRAYELAEKGVQRVENRADNTVALQPQIVSLGNPSDYSQACTNCGKYCGCYKVETCVRSTDCQDVETCSGLSCCPSPLPHSHLVANGCGNVSPSYRCSCRSGACSGSCTCNPNGSCTYDCDEGYVWNPTTLQCEPVAVIKAGLNVPQALEIILADEG
jgi:hypothetical protein